MGKKFCVGFQMVPLQYHTKYHAFTWKNVIFFNNVEILRDLKLKSSCVCVF